MDAIDWGNVPSWISAIVSIAAFVAASLAARAAWKQVKFTASDQYHRNSLREQEYASRVAVWASPSHTEFGQIEYHYANFSDLPIFNLLITPAAAPHRRAAMQVVAPTDKIRYIIPDRINEELPSGLKFSGIPLSKEKRKALFEINERVHALAQSGVYIQFRDAAGQVWRRDPNGNLAKADRDSDKVWLACFSESTFGAEENSSPLPDGVEVELFVDGMQEVRADL